MPNCLGQKPLLLFQSVGIICFDNTNEAHETIDIPIPELIFDHKLWFEKKVSDVAWSYFEFE